jgi:hypothetical protein
VDIAVAVRLLQQADVLANEQDALGWQLRIAISLAERHLEREERVKARAVLAPVYETFNQGFRTRDLSLAAQILRTV